MVRHGVKQRGIKTWEYRALTTRYDADQRRSSLLMQGNSTNCATRDNLILSRMGGRGRVWREMAGTGRPACRPALLTPMPAYRSAAEPAGRCPQPRQHGGGQAATRTGHPAPCPKFGVMGLETAKTAELFPLRL